MKNIFILLSVLMIVTTLFSDVHVKGYYRSNGTYVAPHYRSSPNNTKSDNWSTYGNVNPYTGKEGTKKYDDYNNYGRSNNNNYQKNTSLSVSNGKYVGSTLLCNNGYKDVGGQCARIYR